MEYTFHIIAAAKGILAGKSLAYIPILYLVFK